MTSYPYVMIWVHWRFKVQIFYSFSVRVLSLSWLLIFDYWFVIRFPKPLLCSLMFDPFFMIPLIWYLIWSLWYTIHIHLTLLWLWLWYAMIRICCYDYMYVRMLRSLLMPEFSNYSWRYHGRVIEAPMAWHFLWRCDWSTASPFDMIWLCALMTMIMLGYVCMYGGRMDAS